METLPPNRRASTAGAVRRWVRKCVRNCLTASRNRLAAVPNGPRVNTLLQDLRSPAGAALARNYAP